MNSGKSVLAFLTFFICFIGALAQVNAIFPVSIASDFINPVAHPGEKMNFSIIITPTTGDVRDLRLSTTGKIAQFITLQETSINLDLGETKEVGIELDTEGASVGPHSGFLILNHKDSLKEIPIKITITAKEANIDAELKVVTKEVELPEPIKFQVTIYNVGQRDKFNLHMSHKLNSEKGGTLATQEEDATLVTSLNLQRTFFSEDYPLEEGTYYIETTVSYDDKTQTFVDTFKFNEPFWTTTNIAILIFLIIIAAFAVGFMFTGRG